MWFVLCQEQFGENPAGKMLDCPMGAMTSTLEKLLIMQEFYTEGYGQLPEIMGHGIAGIAASLGPGIAPQ